MLNILIFKLKIIRFLLFLYKNLINRSRIFWLSLIIVVVLIYGIEYLKVVFEIKYII